MAMFVICTKHNKTEKNSARVPANTYICMDSNCPDSYQVMCNACKN
jgi:hypothetical protein